VVWRPSQREGLRVDAGVHTGSEVSPYYDAMVAKLIAWAPTREQARRRLLHGLADTALFGPTNNRGFLMECLEADDMVAGRATTAFLEENPLRASGGSGSSGALLGESAVELAAAAAVLQFLAARDAAHAASVLVSERLLDWGSSGARRTRMRYRMGEHETEITVRPLGASCYQVAGSCGEEDWETRVEVLSRSAPAAELRVGTRRHSVLFHSEGRARLHLAMAYTTLVVDDLLAQLDAADEEQGGGRVVAPMHGNVVSILVATGDLVGLGTRLAVVEAMKMQHELTAQVAGVVTIVAATEGQQVAAGDLLIEIEETEETGDNR
jgi:geranyl-CoA carboxylase alpha subunit